MFAPLPDGFPALEAMARRADGGIPPPPDLSTMGDKVYRACKGRSAEQMPELRSSTRRRIPYAMWLDSQRDINTEAPVVGWYYEDLGKIELKGTSRTRRALAPLFHTYVVRFDPAEPSFISLADNLREVARRCVEEDVSTLRLAALHDQFLFFAPKLVGQKVAEAILSAPCRAGIDGWFESIGMWPGFKSSALGLHIFGSALQLPPLIFRESPAIGQVMAWTRALGSKTLSIDLKGQLASALLKPWLNGDPPEEIKRSVGDFCVQILGDPRFEGAAWTRVDPAAKALILRWLTGRTLDAFFDVLRATADKTWEHRRRFWTAYYRNGSITEAWAVLGPDAKRYVQQRYSGSTADLSFGLLGGQYDQGQSVLLMRMGDLLFCEWSHNGKLRVAAIGSAEAPSMYQRYYDAADLRFDSMVFVGYNGVPHNGLSHVHSDTRWWQTTAALFIQKKLGLRP